MAVTIFNVGKEIDEFEEIREEKPTAHLYGAPSPGPSPLASFMIRFSQFFLNLVVLGLTCATVRYRSDLTGNNDAEFGKISFFDFVAFRFLVASCLIAALYDFFLSFVSLLKMCNLLGGRKWTDRSLWLQVAGDTVAGQLVFASASAAAVQAAYNQEGMATNGYGKLCHLGYSKFCVLMDISWPLAFLVAFVHFGSFWIFTRAAYKTYF